MIRGTRGPGRVGRSTGNLSRGGARSSGGSSGGSGSDGGGGESKGGICGVIVLGFAVTSTALGTAAGGLTWWWLS